jgi:hypothetical protein
MSPVKKQAAVSDVYTALLALATAAIGAAAIFTAVKCYMDYGTIFKIVAQ